jgi:ATP-dependent DNA ligase
MRKVVKKRQAMELMEDAMARGEEGIMLKPSNMPYEPDTRCLLIYSPIYVCG